MDLITLRSLFTVLVFVAFIAVWVWAWSSRRKQAFEEAAQLPFREEIPQQRERAAQEVVRHE